MKNTFSKKLKSLFIATAIVFSIGGYVVNAENPKEKLLKSSEMSEAEWDKIISDEAKRSNQTEEETINQILREMEEAGIDTDRLGDNIEEPVNSMARSSYGNKDTLDEPKYNGDIFYIPASTLGIEHGHVGIYYSSSTIVEADYEEGVRSLPRKKKEVTSGSKIFTLSNVSVAWSNDASNWAYSRIGDKYSLNFATNRYTGHYGPKNCSKLVWSAYKIEAKIDLDSNGGAGVYPNDILNYKYSRVYRTYR